jgi:hypothetical protein
MDNELKQKAIGWFGDISNIAALLAIAIVIRSFFPPYSKLFTIIGLGTLVLIAILKCADVGRFKDVIKSYEDIPPLGLAKGSIRALLALGFFMGLGLYLYYSSKIQNYYKEGVFTALSSLVSVVAGFYFGAKTAAAPPTAAKTTAPDVSDINPDEGLIGDIVLIDNLSGSGFQEGAAVSLVLGSLKISADNVKVASPTKITCRLNLKHKAAQSGKWNVVVTNPDGQKDILVEGFEITSSTSS